jgi:hypothetical protein
LQEGGIEMVENPVLRDVSKNEAAMKRLDSFKEAGGGGAGLKQGETRKSGGGWRCTPTFSFKKAAKVRRVSQKEKHGTI